ncbi:MAG: quinone-dependent dihydroorotate dehydrogenase [Verrucomicrobia bacterium]|nr:quinone-dependent dihydroorotate dehydrogenase [Verrucomicrobiota bacterium]
MLPAVYERLIKPWLFRKDPEEAHELALHWLQKASLQPRLLALLHRFVGRADTPATAREVFGVRFPNPIGLAAGMDKNGLALRAWEALGFGFIEAGTLTAHAQPGNDKPRLFRQPAERSLINRMGFNNLGSAAAAERFTELRAEGRWPSIPVGINIGKSKITPLAEAEADYLESFKRLHPFADYLVVNVSSPNTPGLRELQDKDALARILAALQAANKAHIRQRPILVKIAPDLTEWQMGDVAQLAVDRGLAGIVATNTTTDFSRLPDVLRAKMQGGLSGAPLRERATAAVKFFTQRTKLPVIAVGGVETPDHVQEKFDAGAALVQVYTGFVYGGPTMARDLVRALAR